MKYILILFLAMGINLQAHEYVTDKCGQTWTRTTKWFRNPQATKRFIKKLKRQESVCGDWRSYEDVWRDEDANFYSVYVSYWIKAERKK
jgi:hypothetical protein